MIDKWIGMSYYQFPSFTNSLQRSLYEEWHSDLDGEDCCVDDEEEIGEEECWD